MAAVDAGRTKLELVQLQSEGRHDQGNPGDQQEHEDDFAKGRFVQTSIEPKPQPRSGQKNRKSDGKVPDSVGGN